MPEDMSWLDEKHGIYEQHRQRWRLNERRLRGGEAVLDELRPFSWEYEKHLAELAREEKLAIDEQLGKQSDQDLSATAMRYKKGDTTDHYKARRNEASYINFPDMFATAMTGHLMRQAPSPQGALSFGTLGEVRRKGEPEPTAAELVYYNVDGAGSDGSHWDVWWSAVYRRAMATGHRWVFCDHSATMPQSQEDWARGFRPYLTEFSPLQVPLWHFQDGELAFAVVRYFRAVPRLENGQLRGLNPDQQHYLLLVREGFGGLGDEYAGGGWWLYDPEKKLATTPDGEELKGTWESTRGQIPMVPVYYDRDKGTSDLPAFSRSGITELGQLAVSYMNLASAWDHDIWDAGGSVQLILGVTQEAFNITTGLLSAGNKMAPVPKDDQTNTVPQVYDASLGAVEAQVFSTRLDVKRDEARELAAMESVGSPDASGASKRAGFADLKSPRLALMASELEQAQAAAIFFLERRFNAQNGEPSGNVEWDREFELVDVLDEIREIFSLEALSKLRSGSLGVEAMMKAVRDRGIVTDDALLNRIEQEYRDSAENRANSQAAEQTLMSELGEF